MYRLISLLLLPLALTSPYVLTAFQYLARIAQPLFFFIAGVTRRHVQHRVILINHYLSRFHCSKKCRAFLIASIRKHRVGVILTNCLVAVSKMLPIDVRLLLWKMVDFISNTIPSNVHILKDKLFSDRMTALFVYLFVFRYLRLVVHLVSFWCFYQPAPVPKRPTVRPSDCTIILPTVDPENRDFEECLTSCLLNFPGEIIVVPVGSAMTERTKSIVGPYQQRFPETKIRVKTSSVANKRIQVAHGLQYVNTKITVLLDDHVFWPSARFLPTILAPFEDPRVGIVGTNKRVRRTDTGLNIKSFWNMLGALYLERHNFEIRATNAMDGGVFVVSGRTSAHRSQILTDPKFIQGFTNERFFFDQFGPLNADDDNFITRWNVRHGYKIKIQYCRDACIETTLGTFPKFLSQCLRWVRTTWRSNSASLFTDRTVWRSQPWCVYAVYLTSFVNFALFYDAALVYTLVNSKLGNEVPDALSYLLRWIFISKMVKLTPYFLREPQDLIMLPGYFLFAYFHSLIKLYAGLTFWETNWSGRNLEAINSGAKTQNGTVSEKKYVSEPRNHKVKHSNRVPIQEAPRSKPAVPSPRFDGKLPFSPDTPIPSIESDADTMTTPVTGRASKKPVGVAGGRNGPSGAARSTTGTVRRGRGRPRKS